MSIFRHIASINRIPSAVLPHENKSWGIISARRNIGGIREERPQFMNWIKKGFIFGPCEDQWMYRYAQVPTPLIIGNTMRIYFGCRPRQHEGDMPISQIGYVDVDRADPTQVIKVSERPVLSLGGRGYFDEFGLQPLSILRNGADIWMYYQGWTRMVSVPYSRAIGLAVSRDGGETFDRYGLGPVIGPTVNEPFLQQGARVNVIDGVWHMWYLSGLAWVEHCGAMESIYQMMHATSDDGVQWVRDGRICLPTVEENECQAGQSVIKIGGLYHMWFSFRSGLDFRNAERGYRIGYAWSDDLLTWHRDDSKAGIVRSQDGWDSEMLCYPNIFEVDGRILMLYCGNYFGRVGFGYASLSDT